MDLLLDLLMTLAKALIDNSIAFLFSRIPSKKSKKKTTRKTIAGKRGRPSKK